MEIVQYSIGTLPDALCEAGKHLIRKRFKQEWHLTRVDVTLESICRRTNLLAFDRGRLIGWLGLETSGEFTNACVERGLPGTRILQALITEALERAGDGRFTAWVPFQRTGSAWSFLCNGFELTDTPVTRRVSYPEGDIGLVLLERDRHSADRVAVPSVQQRLAVIRRLRDVHT